MKNPKFLNNFAQYVCLTTLILGMGCVSKHDKKASPQDSALPRYQSFMDACLSSTSSDSVKNLIKLVLEHPLVASQDCQVAAGKLEKLEGLGLSTNPDERVEVDLSPLGEFKNLTQLGLFYLKVLDLSSISGLPLKSLVLMSNDVSDLSPLSPMSTLEILSIANNPITSLAPVAKLPLGLFSINFSEDVQNDLGLDEASCPTADGTNPEIRGECLVRRSHGQLWLRGLVGTWVEGSDTNGHMLHIDEQGRYELVYHNLKNGKRTGFMEKGSFEHADWLDSIGKDGLRFLPSSSTCMPALSETLGRDSNGLAGFKREQSYLTIQFKAMFQLKFQRGQALALAEELPCSQ